MIESFTNPHLLADAEQRAKLDDETQVGVEVTKAAPVVRQITDDDVDRVRPSLPPPYAGSPKTSNSSTCSSMQSSLLGAVFRAGGMH